MEKRPFFWAATAGLGKYHTGGYGRIGVYRVKLQKKLFRFDKKVVLANILSLTLSWWPHRKLIIIYDQWSRVYLSLIYIIVVFQ